MQNATKITEYILGAGYADIDPAVILRTKDLTLSALGSAALGANMEVTQTLVKYAKASGAPPEAGVIGGGFQTSVELAAFINCSGSHCTELEDVAFPEAVYTAFIIPTLFGLGEKLGSSGKAVLEAIVLGYEITARPGTVITNDGLFARGGQPAPHMGTLGVAGAAARLLGLGFEQTRNAITLAASLASGLARQTGSGAHVIEAGLAGRDGIIAAMLAQQGLTGNPDILEGKSGYWDFISGHPDLDFELGTGKDFRLMEVGIKRYPCCYFLQRVIDGVIELRDEHGIVPEDIDRVDVRVNSFFTKIVRFDNPQDGEEARFSLPHAVAASLTGERVFFETFTPEKVHDPRLVALRSKVRTLRHADWEGGVMDSDTPVAIRMKNGTEYKKSCVVHHGEPRDPLSQDEIIDRFKACCELALPAGQVDQVASGIYALEGVDDVSDLMRLMTFAH